MELTIFKKSIYFLKKVFYNNTIQQGFSNKDSYSKGEKEMEESRRAILERLEKARKVKEEKREQRLREEEQARLLELKRSAEERRLGDFNSTVGNVHIGKEIRINKGTNPDAPHRKKYEEILRGEHKFTNPKTLERANKVYNYLLDKVKAGKKIPCMYDIADDLSIPYSSLRDMFLVLQTQKKLTYTRGKVTLLKVAEGTIEKEMVYKEVKTQGKLTENEFLERYDKAVKEIISDLIRNSTANNKDEFIKYIESITNVTDALRNKLI